MPGLCSALPDLPEDGSTEVPTIDDIINAISYDEHIKRCATISRYHCPTCNKNFANKFTYVRHRRRLHLGQFGCTKCSKSFLTKGALRKHQFSHDRDAPASCDLCGKTFLNQRLYSRHNLRVHSHRKYMCAHCPKSFCDRYVFNQHLNKHFGVKSFICYICDKAYYNHTSLAFHNRAYHSDSNITYQCDLCQKYFSAKSRLIYHLKKHAKTKELLCEQCGKAFSDSAALRNHLETHQKSPEVFQCLVCLAQFKLRKYLVRHMRQHITTDQCVCEVCGLLFDSKNTLKFHRLVQHTEEDVDDSSSSDEKELEVQEKAEQKLKDMGIAVETSVFGCELCGGHFSTNLHLKHHMKDMHDWV